MSYDTCIIQDYGCEELGQKILIYLSATVIDKTSFIVYN